MISAYKIFKKGFIVKVIMCIEKNEDNTEQYTKRKWGKNPVSLLGSNPNILLNRLPNISLCIYMRSTHILCYMWDHISDFLISRVSLASCQYLGDMFYFKWVYSILSYIHTQIF